MTKSRIHHALADVLKHIQQAGGYADPSISGTTRPLEDLEGFDSHMGVVATSLLATTLGVEIPADRNLFVSANGTQKLNVNQIVEALGVLMRAKSTTASADKQ